MSVIDPILSHEVSQWIIQKISELPNTAKFRAFNSIRSLHWANKIYEAGLPIPACYCALHATEEAVAAFVSCAKYCKYGDDAKINIKGHDEKIMVSLLVEKIVEFIQDYKPAIAFDKNTDAIISKLTVDGQPQYNPASTKLIAVFDDSNNLETDFYEKFINTFGGINDLVEAISKGQNLRNDLFCASDKGYPKGFVKPEQLLKRECQATLSLIWAALDIYKNKDEQIPFIVQALKTANLVISQLNQKKKA